MQIEFDTDKRDKTLAERGLDFARAAEVFASVCITIPDERQDYGEPRLTTVVVSRSPHGSASLDPARRGTPHHQHEESQ